MAPFIPTGSAAIKARARCNDADRALIELKAANADRLAALPAVDRRPANTVRRVTLIALIVAVVILAVQFLGIPLLAGTDLAVSYRTERAELVTAQRYGIKQGNRVRSAWAA